jgi:hypothetical protein
MAPEIARLIMLYVQSEALRTTSRDICTGLLLHEPAPATLHVVTRMSIPVANLVFQQCSGQCLPRSAGIGGIQAPVDAPLAGHGRYAANSPPVSMSGLPQIAEGCHLYMAATNVSPITGVMVSGGTGSGARPPDVRVAPYKLPCGESGAARHTDTLSCGDPIYPGRHRIPSNHPPLLSCSN